MKKVCSWPKGEPLMVKYHDREWGKPVRNDRKIFEFLVLESAQAGLSWLTILRKREGYRYAKYMWSFVKGRPIDGKRQSLKDLPATSKESETFTKDLKRRGFKFLGPIVIYAHMQAVGMVNDHVLSCFRHKELKTVKSCFMSTRE